MSAQPIGARHPIWSIWLVEPVLAQLRQGITPEKIALTIALGAMLGIFPVLGSTTLLCAAAGVTLRLNQPILQIVNYLVYPLQLVSIPIFIRIGERIFRAPPLPFSIAQMLEKFREAPAHFFREFAMTFAHCITAWLLIAPVCGVILYFALRPALSAAASKLRS
jgi:uncharacterized protein (DUF2062 family)